MVVTEYDISCSNITFSLFNPQGPQRDHFAVLRPDFTVDVFDGGEPHRRRPPPQQQRRQTAARHQGGEGRIQAAVRPPLEQGQSTGETMTP